MLRREGLIRGRLEELLAKLAESGGAGSLRVDPSLREDALAILEAAMTSRLLDLKARELKDEGQGYYTIGSSGHEMNAVLGRFLRETDPCLLHYRSGGFMAARTRKVGGETFVSDTLLSLCASREDPVSGGRHKVWGSKRLFVPPQTSTIASHLPKAVGMAFSLERAFHLAQGQPNRRFHGLSPSLPKDALVMVSFGDASLNHASATTAFNAATWAAHQHIPMPVLFVCENNGLGISVHTPEDWIPSVFRNRTNIDYFEANGCDLFESMDVVAQAIAQCRRARRPVFLNLRVVRLLGHAGSDVESLYRSEKEVQAMEKRDPLLSMVSDVVEAGFAKGSELLELYRDLQARIQRVADKIVLRPKLETVSQVVEPLELPDPESLLPCAEKSVDPSKRAEAFSGRLPEEDRPRHLAMLLSHAMKDLMLVHPEILVFGEDVAKKGGVYHVTAGLFECFGAGRVFNTLLDETTILGLAIGAAQVGFLPMPEIQYLAYLHNAEDQLRGEACSQRFFSNSSWDNPMVVRIASFGYQKGFGGHFHNANSIGVLRDIPGLILAAPSRGDDAVGMLRTCVAAAKVGRSVCAFLEPIALYMTKDLYEKGDQAWSFRYPAPGSSVPLGAPRSYPAKKKAKLLVISYGNGVPMCLQARRGLGVEDSVELMDLRWLSPLPEAQVLEAAERCEGVLIVDECRKTGGGVAEALLARLGEEGYPGSMKRVSGEDTYIPLGPAADLVMPSVSSVRQAIGEMLSKGGRKR
ncbi:MAG TPA: MFS transporter [Planctomycetes bacterium]|nr:MFS transporter [Planctomycetota bacterium]